MDAFDRPAKPEPKVSTKLTQEDKRKFIGRNTNKWVAFDHPTAGRVVGICTGAIWFGYDQPNDVPDYRLKIIGRSKTKRNEIEVNLLKANAHFSNTEQEAETL